MLIFKRKRVMRTEIDSGEGGRTEHPEGTMNQSALPADRAKSLRERRGNSNNFMHNLPIVLQNSKLGEKISEVDPMTLPKFLDLDEDQAFFLLASFFDRTMSPVIKASFLAWLQRFTCCSRWKASL